MQYHSLVGDSGGDILQQVFLHLESLSQETSAVGLKTWTCKGKSLRTGLPGMEKKDVL